MKPLEVAPIFLEPRLRLVREVPVVETLEFARKFKDDDNSHPHIKYFVEKMAEGASRFFAKDIYQLSILKCQLDAGRYRMTSRGILILSKRLRLTYSDGVEYHVATGMLRDIEIEPILELEPTIQNSERIAFGAKMLSKEIGEEMGIGVSISVEKGSKIGRK